MRPRHTIKALFAAAALAAIGCNQAHGTPPVLQSQAVEQAPPPSPLPPIATATLPPTPVPATFDVAGLAEQVRATVVNITTTQKVAVQGSEGGMDPFDFFFGQRGQGGGGGPRSTTGSSQTRTRRSTGSPSGPKRRRTNSRHASGDASGGAAVKRGPRTSDSGRGPGEGGGGRRSGSSSWAGPPSPCGG